MAQRVDWTEEENLQIATHAHQALLADPQLDVLDAIRQAQTTLPKNRRRFLKTWRLCEATVEVLEQMVKQKLQVPSGPGGRIRLQYVRPSQQPAAKTKPAPRGVRAKAKAQPTPKRVPPSALERPPRAQAKPQPAPQARDDANAARIADLEQQLTTARQEADDAKQRHAALHVTSEATRRALATEQAARQALQQALQSVSTPTSAPAPALGIASPPAIHPGSIWGHLQAAIELAVAAGISKALATPTVRSALLDAWVDLQSAAAPVDAPTAAAPVPCSPVPTEPACTDVEPEPANLQAEDERPKPRLPRIVILGLLPGSQRETLRLEFGRDLNLVFLKDEPLEVIKQHAKNAERVFAVANFTTANQRATIKAASKSYTTVTGTTNELRHQLLQFLDDYEAAKSPFDPPRNGTEIFFASAGR